MGNKFVPTIPVHIHNSIGRSEDEKKITSALHTHTYSHSHSIAPLSSICCCCCCFLHSLAILAKRVGFFEISHVHVFKPYQCENGAFLMKFAHLQEDRQKVKLHFGVNKNKRRNKKSGRHVKIFHPFECCVPFFFRLFRCAAFVNVGPRFA